MSQNQSNLSAIFAAITVAAATISAESLAAARAVKSDERTKEQKLVIILDEVTKGATRYDNVLNDRAPITKAKAEAYEPAVGDTVLATVGRNTATSQAKVVEGTVTAVKKPAEGEKGATQVRVRIFAGTFDEQLVTLYPAQLQKKQEEVAAAE